MPDGNDSETVMAFDHRRGAREAAFGQKRRANARLRRLSRMQTLGRTAVGQIFDDSGCERARDAYGVDDFLGRKIQRRGDTRRRSRGLMRTQGFSVAQNLARRVTPF